MKSRFDSHIHSTQQRINEERESARKESKVVIDELNTKVGANDSSADVVL